MSFQDRVIKALIAIQEKIATLATKEEVQEFRTEVLTTLDHHTKMLQHLDVERLAMITRIERIEDAFSG